MPTVRKWKRPANYIGAEWWNWYSAGFGQHRDSDALERANFQAAWDRLKSDREVADRPSVQIVHEQHWAVGWIEWIAIHESDSVALAIARDLCAKVEDYSILDESLFSRIEDDDCAETWANCYSPRERIAYFRTHGHTVQSIGALLRAVRGDWCAAANMLHCPSDLLY